VSPHIKTLKYDIAEDVVISGDPERVRQLSSLLEGSKEISSKKGYVIYTGSFNHHPVTLASHGIGGPSISTLFKELKELGVKRIVRFGTTGALIDQMEIGDAVVATGASYSPGGTIYELSSGLVLSPSPDLELTYNLYKKLKDKKINTYLGQVFSKNAFYTLEDVLRVYRKYNIVSLEMECATLLTLSQIESIKSACVLMVSDSVVKKTKMYTADELKEFAMNIGKAILETLAES
jgi:5'-methylthioadenosine phosphorylase